MYYDTLHEAINIVRTDLIGYGVTLSHDAQRNLDRILGEPMKYEEVRRVSVPIESLNGRNTKKWFHAVITRLDSGRYEPLSYPL